MHLTRCIMDVVTGVTMARPESCRWMVRGRECGWLAC
jgi:hypothetical protein